MKSYFKDIDVFKGISILLIILLHSRSSHPINLLMADDMQAVNGFITLMSPNALFFFSSGFLFKRKDNYGEFLKKKTRRLLIPMLFFGLISILLRTIATTYTNSQVGNLFEEICSLFVGKYYWFLYSLFIMFCLKFFLNRNHKRPLKNAKSSLK